VFAIYPTCFLLISVCLITALANPKRPMSFEDVLAINRASDVQISPDGRRTAFVVDSWDRENDRFNSDIWLAYDIREPAIRLTTHPQRDGNPRWSPDSRRLAFLAERSAEAQIFMIDARGGEPLQLTSHTTSIQNFEWSPDGRFIAFIAEEPREKPEAKPPVVVDLDHSSAQLWVVEIATQQIKQLTTGSLHITAFNWSPDGSSIVFTARATPKLLDSHSTEVFITPADLNNAPHDTAGARQATRVMALRWNHASPQTLVGSLIWRMQMVILPMGDCGFTSPRPLAASRGRSVKDSTDISAAIAGSSIAIALSFSPVSVLTRASIR
jgi:dipeptidyl aminopeptidase/acylaminoacyl peptidase